MKLNNIHNFTFLLLLLCSFNVNTLHLHQIQSPPIKSVESSPIFKVILSQMKISVKQNQENGFERILSLLNELIDSTKSAILNYEQQQKAISFNCTVTNQSMYLNHQKLIEMRNNYTAELKKLDTTKEVEQEISNLKNQLSSIRREKDNYVLSYKNLSTNNNLLQPLLTKAFSQIDCVSSNFLKLYSYSIKIDLKTEDKTMVEFLKKDTNFCYTSLKSLISDISALDDTNQCLYKEQLETNIIKTDPENKSYLVSSNSSKEINSTLNNMANYYKNKFSNFTNYDKSVLIYDTKISSFTKLINSYENDHKSNYDILRKNLQSLLTVNELSIQSSINLLNLLNKQCSDQASSFLYKIATSNDQYKSYINLKLYFMNNYGDIEKSMRNKYQGNINVTILNNTISNNTVKSNPLKK